MSEPMNWSTCVAPPRLRPGDRVAVVAPSGPVPPAELGAALEILAARYRLVYDEAGLLARAGYLAGDDDRRAEELERHLADPDVRAIFMARGGYGLMRVLERLNPAVLAREPKPIVGFSDGTALLAFALRAGVRPIHGPVAVQLPRLPAAEVAWLFRLLEDPSPAVVPGALYRLGGAAPGVIEGRLVGGNLELVTRLIGTPWQLDLDGAIFFFEEVGERPYRLDRMLTQLHLAGALDGVRGALCGELVRCEEPPASADGVPAPLAVVAERLARVGIVGAAGAPFGHGAQNVALPVGARALLDLGRGELILQEGAVARDA